MRTMTAEIDGLNALAAALKTTLRATFDEAVETLLASEGRIVVTGMGKSGHIARKVTGTLASTGTPAFLNRRLETMRPSARSSSIPATK